MWAFWVLEATGSDMKNHSAETRKHGMPSKNSRNKIIQKESYKFNSGFWDRGYLIFVEKANKQDNSQSTAHPQNHPIPKL